MKPRTDRLRDLLEINRAITGTDDYDAILALIVEKARTLTDARACLLLLARPDARATIAASTGLASEKTTGFTAALDERIETVLRARLDLTAEDELFAVPMVLRGNVRGILAIVRTNGTAALQDREEEFLLSALADQAAIALGHATHLGELQAALEASDRLAHALATSEADLRALIDLAPDPFFLADVQGRFVDVNQAACRLLGYERQELVGRTITDILPSADAPRLAQTREALLVPGHVHQGEWTIVRKDGTEIPVEVSSNILADGRWQAFARDIRERKLVQNEREALFAREKLIRQEAESANQKLRESEERFRLTIDEAPIGMALVGLDGRFVRVNRALCEIVGYEPAELETLRFRDITHPDDIEVDLAQAARLLRGEISRYQREKRYIRKNGTVVNVMLSAAVLRTSSGEPRGFVSQFEDISERTRRERDDRFLAEVSTVLASSLDYEQTLMEVARRVVRQRADYCILAMLEEDAHVLRFKAVSADPAHTDLVNALGRLALDPNRPSLVRDVMTTRQPHLTARITPEGLASLAQSEEHLRVLKLLAPYSMMELPLSIHGKLYGALVFVVSTSMCAYGPEDLRVATALAERAALAIENGRLYQSAVQATRMRDHLLGVVAHDLRNPLGVIKLQASALRAGGGLPERRDQKPLENIRRSADRMNHLIQDLLDVTLIDARQLTLERACIATQPLLSESIEAHRALARSASLDLRLELPASLPDVWADRHRLFQVLENLIGNAVKFTPAGGSITVGATARDRDVLFWVRDTGKGIPPEGIARAFDRFWQAQHGAHQGAGLGLSIARGIIDAHGGRIWVTSMVGKGSTFWFTVPQYRVSATARAELGSEGQRH